MLVWLVCVYLCIECYADCSGETVCQCLCLCMWVPMSEQESTDE